MLVAELCAGWKFYFQPAHNSATNIEWLLLEVVLIQLNFQPAHNSATNLEWLLPEVVLIRFVSPDDEHCVLKTCREL